MRGKGTFVGVAIDVDKLALSVGAVVLPLANIASTIRPGLLSLTIPKAASPLASVESAGLEGVRRPTFADGLGVVNLCQSRDRLTGERLSGLFLREIATGDLDLNTPSYLVGSG